MSERPNLTPEDRAVLARCYAMCPCRSCGERRAAIVKLLDAFDSRLPEETALLEACLEAQIVTGAPEEFLAEASEKRIREALMALRGAYIERRYQRHRGEDCAEGETAT